MAVQAAYTESRGEDLILRDWLAVDRTALANERTLLAYARTALALAAVGGSLLKLIPSPDRSMFTAITGWFMLVLGAAVFVVGTWRFLVVFRRLNTIGSGAAGAEKTGAAPGSAAR